MERYILLKTPLEWNQWFQIMSNWRVLRTIENKFSWLSTDSARSQTGLARPLGELGNRLGRQPVRAPKMQLRKRKVPKFLKKSTFIHPKALSTGVGRGRQKQVLPMAPKWLGPLLIAAQIYWISDDKKILLLKSYIFLEAMTYNHVPILKVGQVYLAPIYSMMKHFPSLLICCYHELHKTSLTSFLN